MAGAVLPWAPIALVAQQPAPPAAGVAQDTSAAARAARDTSAVARAARDSAEARTVRARDSLEAFERGDTLRAPFARSETPRSLDIGHAYRWDREELAETGASTLADLLERVPGALGYRVAWLVDQETATFLGDFRRVRVFVDGLPFAPPDLKGGGVVDLTALQLWQFESCTIERGAAELRVYLRSWRVHKTIPYTRVDVYTGDQDANTFRGYFGQRFGPGFGLQVAAENLSISQSRQGGDGSRRAGMVRLGWAVGRWSVDAFHEYADHFRRDQARQAPLSPGTQVIQVPSVQVRVQPSSVSKVESSLWRSTRPAVESEPSLSRNSAVVSAASSQGGMTTMGSDCVSTTDTVWSVRLAT